MERKRERWDEEKRVGEKESGEDRGMKRGGGAKERGVVRHRGMKREGGGRGERQR